jgi:hypothetical protein
MKDHPKTIVTYECLLVEACMFTGNALIGIGLTMLQKYIANSSAKMAGPTWRQFWSFYGMHDTWSHLCDGHDGHTWHACVTHFLRKYSISGCSIDARQCSEVGWTGTAGCPAEQSLPVPNSPALPFPCGLVLLKVKAAAAIRAACVACCSQGMQRAVQRSSAKKHTVELPVELEGTMVAAWHTAQMRGSEVGGGRVSVPPKLNKVYRRLP